MTKEEQLKADALDLLNQLSVLLKDVKYIPKYNLGWYPENACLLDIRDTCQELIEEYSPEENVDYYISFGYD